MKILLADDHAVVREGLKQYVKTLGKDIYVDEAVDGGKAWEMTKKNDYDLVILDVSMPGMSGLDVLKRMKDTGLSTHVLMLSVHPEEQYALRALKMGASGYLSKDSAFEELKVAIRKILSGGRYVSAELAEKMIFNNIDMAKSNLHERLSAREFEIMILLAKGKSVTEISKEIYLSRNTVSTYRTRILNKMFMKRNAEMTSYALRNNLIS
jgi:DNA-binding NarL/FixJ family response regulator